MPNTHKQRLGLNPQDKTPVRKRQERIQAARTRNQFIGRDTTPVVTPDDLERWKESEAALNQQAAKNMETAETFKEEGYIMSGPYKPRLQTKLGRLFSLFL